MSRHRFIKTLDLDEELDDFEGADKEDEEYDYNQDPQMRESLAQARNVLGSDFTDREIQDSLWYTYYDVEKTINYLLKNQSEQQALGSSQEEASTLKDWGPKTVARPASAKAFFADSPWLNVPYKRRGLISVEPLHSRSGLLGGSSRDPPKPSKLAALAAARRKKANQSSSENAQSPNSPAALLDKLSQPRISGLGSSEAPTEKLQGNDQPRPSLSRLRKQPVRRDLKSEESPKVPEPAPEPPPESPKHQEGTTIATASPSVFARTMLGISLNNSPLALTASYDPFKLNCDMSEADANPFAGPSPDDIIANAQSASKGMKSKSQPKAGETRSNGIDNATNGVSKVSMADSTRPPKSKNLNVLEEYKKTKRKNNINFVVIGHVDAGKSTLMGRLLWDLNVVDQRTVDKYRREAEKIGKSSFALAWVLDQGTDEREHGVTIDIAMNKFETEKTAFTILDAPGHRDFVPNMIAGASQADFAILVVDASTGSFESGLKGQMKEHALLVRSMGVQRLIIAVNKLDTVSWSQDRYDEISQQTSAFLAAAGFQPGNISFVPCSGLNGDNIVSKSTACSWYTGPTLLSLLESSDATAQKRTLTGPLRLPISQVFNAGIQHPLSVAGRITAGSVQVGDKVTVVPSEQTGYVKALSVDDGPVEWAVAGQNTTIHLSSDIEVAHIKGGDVVCPADAPVPLRSRFTLKVLAFEHLMPMYCNIVIGRLDVPARITKLLTVLDKSTGKAAEGKGKKPRIIKPGEAARIEVTTETEGGIPVEEGARAVLRAQGETVATGLLEAF